MLINSQIANFSFLFLFISMICYWIGPLSRDLFGQSSKKNAKDMQEAQIQETSFIDSRRKYTIFFEIFAFLKKTRTGLSKNSIFKGDVPSSDEVRTLPPCFSEKNTGSDQIDINSSSSAAILTKGVYGKENSPVFFSEKHGSLAFFNEKGDRDFGTTSDFGVNSVSRNWLSSQVTMTQDLPFSSATTPEIPLSLNPSTLRFDISQGLQLMGRFAIIVSNLLLVLLLCNRWKESGHFPLSNLYESLMFLSWSFTLIHLFIENWTQGDKTEEMSMGKYIGAITTPSALFTNAFATFTLPQEMQGSSSLVPALQSNWLMMHVTVMILSYAALILGSLLSIAFLILTVPYSSNTGGALSPFSSKTATDGLSTTASQFNLLTKTLRVFVRTTRKKMRKLTKSIFFITPVFFSEKHEDNVNFLFRRKSVIESSNPSYTLNEISKEKKRHSIASTLDHLSYRILGIGFPFLTIGILSGAVWANEAWGSYWSWDPKETWALLTWLIYAIYLHTRLNKGWEGKKPAVIASLGFVVVWICYLGVNLIGEGLHSYGWIVQ